MKPYPILAAACAAVVPYLAMAETVVSEPVVVTATRTAVSADEALASVTVVTRADIERSQARTVAELLTGEPGLEFSVSGGAGQDTSLFLRGTNSGHVLVLVDGIRVGSATTGSTAWQYLPLAQIERIEIVRGPRSSLYGSEAIGGVVQIFTRAPDGAPRAQASAGYGTYHTRELTAGVSGAGGDARFRANAARFVTEGFNVRKPANDVSEPDRDGYSNNSASLHVGQRLGSAEVELNALQASGNVEFDRTTNALAWAQNQTDFLQQALGARLRYSPHARWTARLDVGSSKDYAESFYEAEFRSRFDTDRRQYSWQNDVTLGSRQLLTLGADYQDDVVSSSTAYASAERDNTGVFAQYQGRSGAGDIALALREDNNQSFGHHRTGNIALGYAFTPGLRGFVAHGTAFKAPSFNELYYPGYGSPALRPEESRSTEAGLRAGYGKAGWSARVYRTDIDQLIDTVCDAMWNCNAANVNRALIRGAELESAATIGAWRTGAGLSYTDPRNRDTDRLLARRARRALKLDLDRGLGALRVGATLLARDRRFDDAANTRPVAGYGLVHLRAHYALARDWELRARLDNLFDKAYEDVYGYNTPGRAVFAGVAYQPR
ncbi:MAG: hypothetical protein A2637_00155 [Candidatus Muproteobacteria bacterium RIFCSPHIGHO2_01_FULL_65_16]|uniref:TonB-dependent vitamin B12 receptor n=2 Tax=Candidatus Muproteobacteria TaxID=1817795 RepID=A0A1F6TPX0_9PROT|nr:MAG: hypothetical protein A2637_00155 [Candidatus Muproteobacteria bacterium RIFCSPHIGHO2_01_FULL_65_16]OGI51721.1 MAG: hypothetical protein A3B81_03570 [Candidatus Muproteobacteria bacterium RIFCSPHIGHO2_02_FULL_65_16]